VKRETPLALYKGLGAVLSGIVPKMAIRFTSFEAYKGLLADKETGKTSVGGIFICVYLLLYPLYSQSLMPVFLLKCSWLGRWCDGSRRCCDSYGSREDSAAGSATLAR